MTAPTNHGARTRDETLAQLGTAFKGAMAAIGGYAAGDPETHRLRLVATPPIIG